MITASYQTKIAGTGLKQILMDLGTFAGFLKSPRTRSCLLGILIPLQLLPYAACLIWPGNLGLTLWLTWVILLVAGLVSGLAWGGNLFFRGFCVTGGLILSLTVIYVAVMAHFV